MTKMMKHTLDSLIENEKHPDIGIYADLAKHLRTLGFSGEYRMRPNTLWNAAFVLECIPDINGHDLVWVCNQIGNVFKANAKNKYDCRDNLRLARAEVFGRGKPYHYRQAMERGCCGSYDVMWTNHRTENTFWFGFNYGH